jgi:DNA mismatch repair protein MLH1
VECQALKKSIESLFAMYLPKGTYPFVYLSLSLPPETIDVNVHPTKQQVHFLNEDLIITALCERLDQDLKKVNTSRTFETTLLNQPMKQTLLKEVIHTPVSTKLKTPDHQLVRTDTRSQSLDSFLVSSQHSDGSETPLAKKSRLIDEESSQETSRDMVQVNLTSILELRAAILEHQGN